ncbi:hypothetical protein Prum_025670 [Phytohabitans rumicis]|uniref:Uncharacterized protein n=1 Tax=Phytohabitans rumicis TaxID=1076125 RepID=A0A6V8L8C4_9ACTN|nr:hypothetical protein Prum_025670 [Phytohabitans rumicis]
MEAAGAGAYGGDGGVVDECAQQPQPHGSVHVAHVDGDAGAEPHVRARPGGPPPYDLVRVGGRLVQAGGDEPRVPPRVLAGAVAVRAAAGAAAAAATGVQREDRHAAGRVPQGGGERLHAASLSNKCPNSSPSV